MNLLHNENLSRRAVLQGLSATGLGLALNACQSAGGPASPGGGAPDGPFMLGIDVLERDQFSLLRGQRVGLICNQTSVNGRGTHTRHVLNRAPGVRLTALYAPEHGVDGTARAGAYVANTRDSSTGLTVYSLYGPTRKPTPAMLREVDVLLFDLQDIGCRSYTYISTMVRAMEACGENNKLFVVLDRPNPIGGLRVEGPGLESRWVSFVGQIPVPYVHGMTAGELARMTNAKGWNDARTRLSVVPMQGWRRGMMWQDTGLRWVRTSPNIPHATSPIYYVATGILGSASNVDIGIGRAPFEYAGARGANADAFTRYVRGLNLPGVQAAPYQHAGFGGARLTIDPRQAGDVTALGVLMTGELNRMTNGRVVAGLSGDRLDIFNKVYGSEQLHRRLQQRAPTNDLVASWAPFVRNFRSERPPFLLYRA